MIIYDHYPYHYCTLAILVLLCTIATCHYYSLLLSINIRGSGRPFFGDTKVPWPVRTQEVSRILRTGMQQGVEIFCIMQVGPMLGGHSFRMGWMWSLVGVWVGLGINWVGLVASWLLLDWFSVGLVRPTLDISMSLWANPQPSQPLHGSFLGISAPSRLTLGGDSPVLSPSFCTGVLYLLEYL